MARLLKFTSYQHEHCAANQQAQEIYQNIPNETMANSSPKAVNEEKARCHCGTAVKFWHRSSSASASGCAAPFSGALHQSAKKLYAFERTRSFLSLQPVCCKLVLCLPVALLPLVRFMKSLCSRCPLHYKIPNFCQNPIFLGRRPASVKCLAGSWQAALKTLRRSDAGATWSGHSFSHGLHEKCPARRSERRCPST